MGNENRLHLNEELSEVVVVHEQVERVIEVADDGALEDAGLDEREHLEHEKVEGLVLDGLHKRVAEVGQRLAAAPGLRVRHHLFINRHIDITKSHITPLSIYR